MAIIDYDFEARCAILLSASRPPLLFHTVWEYVCMY